MGSPWRSCFWFSLLLLRALGVCKSQALAAASRLEFISRYGISYSSDRSKRIGKHFRRNQRSVLNSKPAEIGTGHGQACSIPMLLRLARFELEGLPSSYSDVRIQPHTLLLFMAAIEIYSAGQSSVPPRPLYPQVAEEGIIR